MLLLVAAGPGPQFQRDFIDAGFQLDQLTTLAGTGSDPGASDPEGRLRWAIATAIPAAWGEHVPVQWSIAENGNLALSYPDGHTEVSPELLRRPPETLLATVAHEMGHQVAIALSPGGDGSPPTGFVNLVPGNPYSRFAEGWADCVSRVWTGSTEHTAEESNPCPPDTARYVAVMLSHPINFLEMAPKADPPPKEDSTEKPSPEQVDNRNLIQGWPYLLFILGVVAAGLLVGRIGRP